jgi:deoxyribodipyrimidine photo-lyase
MNIHIFIFRRDLRVQDNMALTRLLQNVNSEDYVLPVFIFNDKQINPQQNKYFNKNSVEFMIQSLKELNSELSNKLHFFHTNKSDSIVLTSIVNTLKQHKPSYRVKSVACNIDFTPYAIRRDEEIQNWCKKNSIEFITSEDYTLLPINTVLTGQGTFFSVYTPFYRKFLSHVNQVATPKSINIKDFTNSLFTDNSITFESSVKAGSLAQYYLNDPNPQLFVQGGRSRALDILLKIKRGDFKEYDKERDFPCKDKTTKLSAYLKFGCISIREAFDTIQKAYGIQHGLIQELVWREFYACVTFNKPRVLEGQIGKKNLPFREKYDTLQWENDAGLWKAFVEAKTGFPFVDAGIRMTYATGFCPNRLRMILAMFATKDLQTNPFIFEKWFAKHLVDYDPSSNSGGVLWSASTGVDSQPYFRIFSPILQTQRYDPEAKFILQWIPELQDVPIKDILNWDKTYKKYNVDYPAPMINHSEQSKKVIELFKRHQ